MKSDRLASIPDLYRKLSFELETNSRHLNLERVLIYLL
jgi:hypothetical protein